MMLTQASVTTTRGARTRTSPAIGSALTVRTVRAAHRKVVAVENVVKCITARLIASVCHCLKEERIGKISKGDEEGE
jgi:hypothetical protein